MTRLSHSGKERYEQCPYKYYLHDIEKYRSTIQKSALVFGNAYDVALNELLQGSSKYHEVFDEEWTKYKDVQIDYYSSDYDESLLTDEERLFSKQEQLYLCLKKKGHLMLDAYKDEIYPKIKQVVSLQERIDLVGSCEDGEDTEDSITGIMDLVAIIEFAGESKLAILDNKSTSQPYAKNSVLTKDQLALYAAAKPEIQHQGFLTINKKNFKTQILVDQIPDERKTEVLDKFIVVLNNIKQQMFQKNTKSCWAFGKRCEFWTHCHQGYFSEDIYKKEN